ncbi:hypothetical protein [Sporichthya polymorpha]|uniref:hypothetical protein n=1 Tax=Sporichthya polymorpha TaxID=35751 RepID=UPI00035C1212|nr:hypothetical protein [Sporichthya polymorpha]
MKRWTLAVVLASLLAVGGCGGASDDPAQPAAAAQAEAAQADLPDPHYALFPDATPAPDWELTDVVRMRADERDAKRKRAEPLGALPGVDWYTEYAGPATDDTDAYLSLTAYTQSLAERKTESVSETSTATDGEINGHPAFWTMDPEDPGSGAVVAWEIAPGYTLELFATGVPLDDLVAMAKTVRDATEAEWAAAGADVLSPSGPQG